MQNKLTGKFNIEHIKFKDLQIWIWKNTTIEKSNINL